MRQVWKMRLSSTEMATLGLLLVCASGVRAVPQPDASLPAFETVSVKRVGVTQTQISAGPGSTA
jgi:hypothetical protein